MDKTYKFAIIGIGAISGLHAQSIQQIKEARLVAGCCRGEDKGRKFAEHFGCQWYSDYLEMLDREKPDAVSLCTPNGQHLEIFLECARRGVHVLCEKPLEVTTERVDRMIAAAREAGIVLGGIFPLRYGGALRAVHTAAAAGRLGPLAVANTYVPWWREDAYYGQDKWQSRPSMAGGGVLMSQAIHAIDALQWLAAAAIPGLLPHQNPVARIFAFTTKSVRPTPLEVEDTTVAVLIYRNGAVGQILGTTAAFPGTHQRFQLAGRDGTAEVLQDEMVTFRFRTELPGDEQIRKSFPPPAPPVPGDKPKPMATSPARFAANVADFFHAIVERRVPEIDGTQARKAVAIIEAIYQSAATGQPVTLD